MILPTNGFVLFRWYPYVMLAFDPRNDWLIGVSYSRLTAINKDRHRFAVGIGPLWLIVTFGLKWRCD